MRSLIDLKREAYAAAEWRGHKINWQAQTQKMRALGECENDGCKAYVQVLVKPAPNEIDIGGDAVAVNCPVLATSP